ncbi:FAD-binding Berberine family protein [Abeliophyllum distichum]|uniref:FAD-binding Berberine family protein n=1 Tax=Abeliophyllum distichum TaxID=126358 RepID=A0ABD1QG46_9LAMI
MTRDYEGLSYLCKTPFVISNLVDLRLISIDLEEETTWVLSKATVGDLYYTIAQNSRIHGFPAGICQCVGIDGHFSGGGIGTMTRQYGLAAENITATNLIDADARILNLEAVGEDLLLAIRGGGGASFGIIVAWKIKLVWVPPVVTVFTI